MMCTLSLVKIVKQFLIENHIKILDWPANRPNLNPIENLWCKIKNLVSKKQPESFSELVKVITEVWVKEISGEYCESLIYSISRQLQAVIDAQKHTKY